MIFVYHNIQLFKWMKWCYLWFSLHLIFPEAHHLLIIHPHTCSKHSRIDAYTSVPVKEIILFATFHSYWIPSLVSHLPQSMMLPCLPLRYHQLDNVPSTLLQRKKLVGLQTDTHTHHTSHPNLLECTHQHIYEWGCQPFNRYIPHTCKINLGEHIQNMVTKKL